MNSIFPELMNFDAPEVETEERTLPLFKEWAYDFEENRFLLRDGAPFLVEKNEALKIWIYKALVTERFRYLAYSDDAGCEIMKVIGTTLSTEAKKAEVRRFVTEALMVNPYITAIKSIEMSVARERLDLDVEVETIYEDKVVSVECTMPIA